MLREELSKIKSAIEVSRSVVLKLPTRFGFKEHDIYDFSGFLSFFDWTLSDRPVKIDMSECKTANYQALSLLVLYAWQLRSQGCRVSFAESEDGEGPGAMWRLMGARGLFSVLPNETQRFNGAKFKPLFAVRNAEDFKLVIESAESYTKDFNVEYGSTLRYVLGELLYNTMEHGKRYAGEALKNIRIPSIVQFTWYKKRNEIHFIIADIGIGVKAHLEQAYPGQESDEAAIKLATRAKVSGTFGRNDPYRNKDNAGMGLYISTNIIRRLNADMYVVSGNGLVHVSPRDVTGRTMAQSWPGTFVLVTLKIEDNPTFFLHKLMQEFREAATKEQSAADTQEADERFYLSIFNYFGSYAEDKEAAIKFRDTRLFPAVESGKIILVDFERVTSSPHSFLSALLASPIKVMGLAAFKRIKIVNAPPEIRETIDFIFDDNT
ncbi:DUF4325 domain-containing protein [Burkholderia sp. AU18528]|uniref:STAS-like domain-containing protein n=1 Tax=Burkholderia TaxID=32008 RepID=UPI0009C185A9|nr:MULTISPECIES: DUF4325 domain-containing protein [Burkholderia]PHP88384.1 DUF4325 domain-containing protein [Burkholderia sp. AU18528]